MPSNEAASSATNVSDDLRQSLESQVNRKPQELPHLRRPKQCVRPPFSMIGLFSHFLMFLDPHTGMQFQRNGSVKSVKEENLVTVIAIFVVALVELVTCSPWSLHLTEHPSSFLVHVGPSACSSLSR
jgi:hypothetical protein